MSVGTKGTKVAHTELSSLACACGKRIKANVAGRKGTRPLSCYPCWKAKEFVRRRDGRPT